MDEPTSIKHRVDVIPQFGSIAEGGATHFRHDDDRAQRVFLRCKDGSPSPYEVEFNFNVYGRRVDDEVQCCFDVGPSTVRLYLTSAQLDALAKAAADAAELARGRHARGGNP